MNTTNIAVTITGSGKIAAVINGKLLSIATDHPNYSSILEAIKVQDWNKVATLADITASVNAYVTGDVQIKDGILFFKNEAVHNTIATRIVNFMRNGLPFLPLVKFLENMMQNPSYRAVNELYDFLEAGELPITTDGHFLAFKNVKADYFDIHSGKYRNMVGDKPSMPRNMVDEDKDRTCSSGLHFCSIKYLPHFSDSNGGHTMIVKINPKDVVAIPADYNNTKGRCCRYEVIGEYTEDWRSKLNNDESGWDADLYDEDGDEYEDFEESCDSCGTILDNYDDQAQNLCNSCAKGDDEDEDEGGYIYKEEEKYPTETDFPGGQHEEKPTYHNLRDEKGRFTKSEQEQIEDSIINKFVGKIKDIVNKM